MCLSRKSANQHPQHRPALWLRQPGQGRFGGPQQRLVHRKLRRPQSERLEPVG
jgi:hypothetical protein